MAKKVLVDTIALDNGLILKFYDGSRKIAGDRWQVACVATVEVPVDYPDAEILSAAGVDRDHIKGIFGDAVVFEKVMERNFIDEKNFNKVVDGLFQSMSKSMVPYLSRPEFPGRFLVRKYREYQKQAAWRKTAG